MFLYLINLLIYSLKLTLSKDYKLNPHKPYLFVSGFLLLKIKVQFNVIIYLQSLVLTPNA